MRHPFSIDLPKPPATTEALLEVAIFASIALMVARVAIAFLLGGSAPGTDLAGSGVLVAMTALLAAIGQRRAAVVIGACALVQLGCIDMAYCMAMGFHVARGLPMQDAALAAIDRAIGFDWVAYLRLVDAHPMLNELILQPAYRSIDWQPLVIVLALAAAGRAREPLGLLLAMTLALMLTFAVACLMPAYGAYHYYGVTPAMHPHIARLETGDGIAAALDWLRAPTLVGATPASQGGLVTFPSFHTCAAVLYLWACRAWRPLFCAALPLNSALLVATPLQGSHYLADMAAGAAVAGIAIALVGALLDPSARPMTRAEAHAREIRKLGTRGLAALRLLTAPRAERPTAAG